MKTFQYVGGPLITSVTMRDGSVITLLQGQHYVLDEKNEYVQTLLCKKNANGMPSPWLVESLSWNEVSSVQHQEPITEKDATTVSATNKRK